MGAYAPVVLEIYIVVKAWNVVFFRLRRWRIGCRLLFCLCRRADELQPVAGHLLSIASFHVIHAKLETHLAANKHLYVIVVRLVTRQILACGAEHQNQHLDLGHIVGGAGDQRGGRELVELGVGEMLHLLEHVAADVARQARQASRQPEAVEIATFAAGLDEGGAR